MKKIIALILFSLVAFNQGLCFENNTWKYDSSNKPSQVYDFEHSDADILAVLIVLDLSKSVNRDRFPTDQELFDYVLKIIGLDENTRYFKPGAVCYLSYIGTDFYPRVVTINLEKGKGIWGDNMARRKKEVEKFKADLNSAIADILLKPSSQNQTNINSGLCYQFQLLREGGAARNHVVLISDGIQVGDGLQFNDDANSKEDIKRASDLLSSKCSLGDLSSFDVTLLACTNEETQSISRSALEIWKYHMEKDNALVRIRSDLF